MLLLGSNGNLIYLYKIVLKIIRLLIINGKRISQVLTIVRE